MKFPISIPIVMLLVFSASISAQKRPLVPAKPKPAAAAAKRSAEIGQTAVVVDETLAVLRKEPSLFSESVHRMSRGRKVQILGVAEADGVKFFKITAPPSDVGWLQSDAVFGKFRAADENRLAQLAQASNGFEQIEIATQFFELYPKSTYRPAILLLFGDVLEEVAATLTKSANSRLSRKEMAASAAPMHSYYLNFVSLDRYRKLGITFLFNSGTKAFHYDGASWLEIVTKIPASTEAAEAQKRLDALKVKMVNQSLKL